jgi:hypothetical protein
MIFVLTHFKAPYKYTKIIKEKTKTKKIYQWREHEEHLENYQRLVGKIKTYKFGRIGYPILTDEGPLNWKIEFGKKIQNQMFKNSIGIF